ncbi:hypothetical protein HMN09_00865500 [Mycena chlorophos]|uniref:DUF6532 domain-containing protein n=1 Tax=Mycena chlorophos TaxID=658473 RepID=A0A8H6SQX6_MYCCL|nr:hypothetical protein HMN09_00865500 [Mycena chlorophos]
MPEFHVHIKRCRHLFEARIWCVCAFPSVEQAQGWVVDIWIQVCEQRGEMLELTDRLRTMITDYGWHARGTVAKVVATLVDATWGLAVLSGTALKAKCKVLLTEDGFAHEDVDARKKYPYHPIIKTALQTIWFEKKKSRGIQHEEYFSPIPVPTLALLLTAMEYCIERCATGKRDTDASFDEANNKTPFQRHLKRLTEWDSLLPEATLEYRQQLYDECREAAGAPAIVKPVTGLSDNRRAQALEEIQAMQRSMAAQRVAQAAAATND